MGSVSRFKKGDLVQIDSEWKEIGNPSLFRIRSISRDGVATLGQLSDQHSGYIGIDTTIGVDDPDLVAPYPEVLAMYPNWSSTSAKDGAGSARD
ncbi:MULTISPECIES: hypothetical protein [Mycobacterium avium complex (MAC)]|uniref:hypothetical protein n=1 Tax=Mycobacterium avium complex (MAC) TaxID=120793 RepID=UPI000A0576A2|nr:MULTISPECIES: hypothetical protein [Mycobacterium avium complex (MAC)]UCN12771.1 hypothetical protein LFT50_28010 [Mycobacterium intracellulare subsp. chimaera]